MNRRGFFKMFAVAASAAAAAVVPVTVFAAAKNPARPTHGWYVLDLTAEEMNGDVTSVNVEWQPLIDAWVGRIGSTGRIVVMWPEKKRLP